ncbi:MAG: MFS transporter [Firmicutes bacterium]|nr:MFS transporter [Bacillota bacterium]
MTKERYLTKDIILVLAASFFFMASPMMVTPLIAGFTESLGATAAVMGLMGGVMNLCSLFCRPFVGNLADKISKYKVAFIGSALMALASIGYVLAPDAGLLLAARIVHGVGFSFCTVCLSTWMSNMLPRDKIGTGMGLYGTMNALSMAISPSVGVFVYQHFGYRASFLIATAAAMGTMTMIQFVGDKGEPVCSANTIMPRKPRLKFVDRKVLPVALVIALFTIPYYATQSFLVRYTETMGLDVTVGLFFPAYACVLLVLRLSLAKYFDKLPYGTFVIASCGSALASMICLTAMESNLLMFAASAFMAGGYGIMCSVCQSTALLLAGPEKRGLANNTYYVGMDIGMATGPIIGGFLYGQVPGQLFYPCLMATIPVILLVYVTLCRNIGKKN